MLNTAQVGAKFYLNGFPKAGLHLLTGLMRPLAKPMYGDLFHAPWVSSHQGNSWKSDLHPHSQVCFGIGRTAEGHYTNGHLGYDIIYDLFMDRLGIIHIFIYRDPRDVAVSQAHVLWHGGEEHDKSNSDIEHPARHEFRAMADFDEVLSAVINGHEDYPGVMARWDLYAPWLPRSWMLSVKFEDIIDDRAVVAEQILDHMTARLNSILVADMKLETGTKIELVKAMMVSSHDTDASPTFRRGAVGDWREYFTETHVKQFQKSDGANELIQLGYSWL